MTLSNRIKLLIIDAKVAIPRITVTLLVAKTCSRASFIMITVIDLGLLRLIYLSKALNKCWKYDSSCHNYN